MAVLEGAHVTWRTASAFDSTFTWNACHSYPNRHRMIFVYSIRDMFVCSLAKTFGHLSDRAKKAVIDRLTVEHHTPNKVFVSREGIIAVLHMCASYDDVPWLPCQGLNRYV